MERIVDIYNKPYTIEDIEGTVVEHSKIIEPFVDSNRNLINHNNFFIKVNDNTERSIRLTGWDLEIRAGHNVQMIYLKSPSSDVSIPIVYNNVDLKELIVQKGSLKYMASHHNRKLFYLGLIGATTIGYFLGSFLVFITLSLLVYAYLKYQEKLIYTELQKLVDSRITNK